MVHAETGHGVLTDNHYHDQLLFGPLALMLVGACLLMGEFVVHSM